MHQNDAPIQPNKLFVGNLPFRTTEDELNQLFAEHGEVTSVKIIVDRASGRSKGIAFVEFANEEDAKKAMEALNGFELEGRGLRIDLARQAQPRENRGGFNDRRGGGGYNDRRGGGSWGNNDRRGGYNDRRGGRGGDSWGNNDRNSGGSWDNNSGGDTWGDNQ